jgi:hypothetical protein
LKRLTTREVGMGKEKFLEVSPLRGIDEKFW